MNDYEQEDVRAGNVNEELAPEVQLVTFGFVLRLPIDETSHALKALDGIPHCKIVYQKRSIGRLMIVSELDDYQEG